MRNSRQKSVFANMWGGQSWRDVQPVVIRVSLFAAFGFTALLYAVDARLSYHDGVCNDASSTSYIGDADKRREACG